MIIRKYPESEKMIVGSVLISPDTLPMVLNSVPIGAFTVDSYREVIQAMSDLAEDGRELSIPSIAHKMGGGKERAELLQTLVADSVSTGISHHKKVVRNAYLLEKLVLFGKHVELEAGKADAADDLAPLLDEFDDEVAEASMFLNAAKGMQAYKDAAQETLEAFEYRRIHGARIIPTGYDSIDRVLSGGIESTDFVGIGARSSMGKTALMLGLARNMLDRGLHVGVFSAEMMSQQLIERMWQAEIGASKEAMRSPDRLTTEQYEEMLAKIKGIAAHKNFLIDDTASLTPQYIRNGIKRMQSKLDGVDVVFLDYLQQVRLKTSSGVNHVLALELFSYDLKAMTKQFNTAIFGLSQLSRAVDSRNDKRPQQSDFRGSGGIEQAVDKAWMLYRDDVYNPDTEFPNIMEVLMRKDRTGGGVGVGLLFANKKTGGFTSLDTASHSDPNGGNTVRM